MGFIFDSEVSANLDSIRSDSYLFRNITRKESKLSTKTKRVRVTTYKNGEEVLVYAGAELID